MLLLIGKTCAGKDSIQKILISEYGMKNIVSYTTRPMRDEEENGVQYWFLSTEEFLKKQEEGFFAEVITYVDKDGNTLYYGGAKKDFADDKVMIVNIDGLKQIREFKELNSIAFLLTVSDDTIRERLKKRGDNEEVAENRIKQDNEMFAEAENFVDYILENENISPEEMATRIHKMYTTKMQLEKMFK